jgi:enamine deaminase RidA (YjgF/YER057c/UK114 family)
VGSHELAVPKHSRGSDVCRPALDLTKRFLHGRAILDGVRRRLVSSGSPYEPTIGFSRAVRDGRHVFVAGTCAVMPDGGDPPTNAYAQARRCLEIIVAALREAGAEPEHVVRTRTFLTDVRDSDEVGRAHGEVFGEVRPASTMLAVSGLLDPRWLVEIEADALLPE